MSSKKKAIIDCSKIKEEKLIIRENSDIKLHLLRDEQINIEVIKDNITRF